MTDHVLGTGCFDCATGQRHRHVDSGQKDSFGRKVFVIVCQRCYEKRTVPAALAATTTQRESAGGK